MSVRQRASSWRALPTPSGRGIEPEGEQDPGIDRAASGPTPDRLDRLEQGGQVEADDIVPDGPSGVFQRDEIIEGGGAEDDLVPDGGPEPRDADQGCGRHRDLGSRLGRHLEESGWMGHGPSGAIEFTHGTIIASIS